MAQWAKDGLVNMVGGCCGTTPDHIKLFAEQCALITEVRKVPEHPKYMRLSGLRLNSAVIAP
jgi:5-methyltetrahydrofolate--homocysteine methyltransferase